MYCATQRRVGDVSSKPLPQTGRGDYRHLLAGTWRRWQRGLFAEGPVRSVLARYRLSRCRARVRSDRADRRVRVRGDLRRAFQPGGHAGCGVGSPRGMESAARILDRSGDRRPARRAGGVLHRVRQARLHRDGPHGGQRLWRPFTYGLLAGCRHPGRDRLDGRLPVRHPRFDRRAGTERLRGLALANIVAIPISNASINPARSTAVAFFNGDGAPAQLWVFWLAPLVGGAIAGIAYPLLFGRAEEDEAAPPTKAPPTKDA
jgi:hypothetical protein